MITESNCSMTTISILDLLEQLKFYESRREVTRYTVIEAFGDKKSIYSLMNLTAEKEDEYIIFDDGEGVLEQNDIYVLNMLLLSSIKEVACYRNKSRKQYQANIVLSSGTIQIMASMN